MVGRIARRRRALFLAGPEGPVPANAESAAIVAGVAVDVAAWLGFASVADYDAATPDERQRRALAARPR
jgi:hypothetical protein